MADCAPLQEKPARRRTIAAPAGLAPRATRIGLYGYFGSGNFGNDASLEAMLALLRRACPQAELVCICISPDDVRNDYKTNAVPLRAPDVSNPAFRAFDRLFRKVPHKLADWIHALRCARRLDLLIIPGTGILDDFGTGPSSAPYALLGWCLAARLTGARLAFVSVGAGPTEHPLSRRMMKAAARLAHFRSYRDSNSRQFMAACGLDAGRDPVYPDLAFSLDLPDEAECLQARDIPTVGLGIMAYYGWKNDSEGGAPIYRNYISKLQEFAVWLLDAGYRVRLLMGDLADLTAAQDLLARLHQARGPGLRERVMFEPSRTYGEVVRQMAGTDIVVATRFHNIVAALSLGKPSISLGYSKKNEALMADMGLGPFCQHVETFDLDELKRQFTVLVDQQERLTRQLRASNSRYTAALAEQEALLRSAIL
jgi:polysaccharide pyruvyl transferase WcaK-like protein